MGPIEPPPQKGRIPTYNASKLKFLQEKMDDLEKMGVLAKPEDVGVIVEHVSPSFLIKKNDKDFRLVPHLTTLAHMQNPPHQNLLKQRKSLSSWQVISI